MKRSGVLGLFASCCVVFAGTQVQPLVTISGYTIHNHASVAISACVLDVQESWEATHPKDEAVMHPAARYILYRDSIVDPGLGEIGPETSVTLNVINGHDPGNLRLVAGQFHDGRFFGDSDAIKQLLQRRVFVLNAYKDALRRIENALRDALTREQIVKEFKDYKNAYIKSIPFGEYFGLVSSPYDFVMKSLASDEMYPTTSPNAGQQIPLGERCGPILDKLRLTVNRISGSLPSLK
jgi:hypothetical protein